MALISQPIFTFRSPARQREILDELARINGEEVIDGIITDDDGWTYRIGEPNLRGLVGIEIRDEAGEFVGYL